MRDTIRNKIKSFFAFLIILFLLPYIISVFINGKNAVQGADSDNASVYLAEMLAGETDGGCEIRSIEGTGGCSTYRIVQNRERKADSFG